MKHLIPVVFAVFASLFTTACGGEAYKPPPFLSFQVARFTAAGDDTVHLHSDTCACDEGAAAVNDDATLEQGVFLRQETRFGYARITLRTAAGETAGVECRAWDSAGGGTSSTTLKTAEGTEFILTYHFNAMLCAPFPVRGV